MAEQINKYVDTVPHGSLETGPFLPLFNNCIQYIHGSFGKYYLFPNKSFSTNNMFDKFTLYYTLIYLKVINMCNFYVLMVLYVVFMYIIYPSLNISKLF